MKNNTRKILLALIVALTLLISMATVTAFAEETQPADGTTVYFENNWLWTEVCCYYWGDGITSPEWPGTPMNNVGTLNGHELYSIDLPAGVTRLIFSGIKDDGSGARDQSPDITTGIVSGAAWRMQWDNGNWAEAFNYDPSNPDSGSGSNPGSGSDNGTYTVAGVAGLCSSEWNPSDTYNDMTYNEETGLYEKTFKGIPAGDYKCKVVLNHSWGQNWGGSENNTDSDGNYLFSTFEEYNITITFDASTGTVAHVLSESTGPDEDRPLPSTPEIDTEDTVRVYLANSANWEAAFFYCWTLGSSDQNATWPGVKMEWDGELLLYYADVPVYYENIIFNNGQGTQTKDLAIVGGDLIFDNSTNEWSDIGNYTPPAPPENTKEDITVTVRDDAGWGELYIYYWDADGAEAFVWPGTPMELDENGNYTYTIPAGYYGVVFSNGGSWEDGSLKQTPDLLIPTNGKTYISNGNSCLYDEGTANDNSAWYAGSDSGNQGGNNENDKPSTDAPSTDAPSTDEPSTDTPKEPGKMTFLQKMAKALLLFLRGIQDFFKGIGSWFGNLFGGKK